MISSPGQLGGGGVWRNHFHWLWLLYQDIKERRDEDLLVLPTDAILFEDPSFKVLWKPMFASQKVIDYTIWHDNMHGVQVFAEKYAEDEEAFFKDYAEAHAKLSILGAKFDPPEVFSSFMLMFVVDFAWDANQA